MANEDCRIHARNVKAIADGKPKVDECEQSEGCEDAHGDPFRMTAALVPKVVIAPGSKILLNLQNSAMPSLGREISGHIT